MATCCEFTGAPVVGDSAAVIRIESGTGGAISGITVYAEGCDCGYDNLYDDIYCDPTEGGLYPYATISDFSFIVNDMPEATILTIDSAEQSVKLTDITGNLHFSQFDVLDWHGLFEWVVAAKNGCQRICIDTAGATINGDTDISVSYYDREL